MPPKEHRPNPDPSTSSGDARATTPPPQACSRRTLEELELATLAILTERAKLVEQKLEVESLASRIRNQLRARHRLDPKKYEACLKGEQDARAEHLRIEKALTPMKIQLQQLSMEAETLKRAQKVASPRAAAPPSATLLDKLHSLRAKYSDFAKDPTRLRSMRQLAKQCEKDLGEALAEFGVSGGAQDQESGVLKV